MFLLALNSELKIFAHFYILSALVNEMNEFVSNLRN